MVYSFFKECWNWCLVNDDIVIYSEFACKYIHEEEKKKIPSPSELFFGTPKLCFRMTGYFCNWVMKQGEDSPIIHKGRTLSLDLVSQTYHMFGLRFEIKQQINIK